MSGGGSGTGALSVSKKPWGRRTAFGAAAVAGAVLAFIAVGTARPATFTGASAVGATASLPGRPTSVPAAQLADLSPWSVPPGGRLVVTASGFAPGSTVALRLLSHPVAAREDLRAGVSGAVSTVLAVPGHDRPGWDTVSLDGPAAGGGALQQEAVLHVLGHRT